MTGSSRGGAGTREKLHSIRMRLLLGLAALLALADAYVPAGPFGRDVRMPVVPLRTTTPIAAAKPVAKRPTPVKRAVKPAAKPAPKKAVKPAAKPAAKKSGFSLFGAKPTPKPIAKPAPKKAPVRKAPVKKAVKPAARPVARPKPKPRSPPPRAKQSGPAGKPRNPALARQGNPSLLPKVSRGKWSFPKI